MNCPNCGYKMAPVNHDHQAILHCSNCSGSFFEENGVNRISEKTARILSTKSKETTELKSVSPMVCPKHGAPLKLITENEAIPQHVRLYECPSCKGIFAMPTDLLNFKDAQDARLHYLKSWQIPVPSIRTVMVLGVFLFISILSINTYVSFTKPQLSNVQADDIVNGFYSTASNQLVFIYFKTGFPLSSEIMFEDRNTGEIITKIINIEPSTIHSLTTGDLIVGNEIYYAITLRDENGVETKTALKKLEIK